MFKVKCVQISYKNCLIWTAIGCVRFREVHCREVSALKRPLHRGFIRRVRLSFHLFFHLSSIKRYALKRMSAIKKFHFILKCYLFRIDWEMSAAFIYSVSFTYIFISYPRNIHEKDFGHTKYPQKKISELRKYDGLMARDPWNLSHSFYAGL